ncbi:S41 family peptidase [Thermomonas brevis]
MRVKLLSTFIALALLPLAAAAQDAPAPADAAVQDAATPAEDDPEALDARASKVPLEEIRRYVTVFNAIRQAYVDPVDDHKLMSAAVRGLLFDLDPHSAYMEKADAEQFDEQTRGTYDGVGVELQQMPDGTLRVVAPLDDSPAERAGLRSGDRIIAIDGKLLRAGQNDSSAPLRGKAGSKVVVKVVRGDAGEPYDVTLVRDTIRATSVRSKLLEPGFGYIRIASFQASTAADFAKQLDALQKDAPLRGLVLDLRSNPGGLLVGAVQIADELLEKGGIVSTRGRESMGDSRFERHAGGSPARRAGGGAGGCGLGQRRRSAGRCAARQQARARGRQPHLRQGLRADPAAAG